MAKKKTVSKKRATKKATSSAKKRAKRSSSRAEVLTTEKRSELLRPPDGYDELVRQFIDTWKEHPSLRVTDLSARKLISLLAKSERAFEKESALQKKMEARMAPVRDARMMAEDAVWRAVLDAYAIAKAQGRRLPELDQAFAFFGDKLGGRPRSTPDDTPASS